MAGLLLYWQQLQLGLFSWQRNREWHKRIDATAAGKHPTLDRLSCESFPWDALRRHTETYLSKKDTLTIQQREGCLTSLIKKHAAKDIAIAACAHALDISIIRHLLLAELSLVSGTVGLLSYLQAVAAARTVNEASVTDMEAYQAKVLMDFLTPGNETLHHSIGVLLPLLMVDDICQKSLLSRPISEIARTSCEGFAAQVEDWKSCGLWLQAYQSTRVLLALSHRFLDSDNVNPAAKQTLNSAFPDWQVWCSWKPDQDRLKSWEAFTAQERTSLQYLLALEGPDFHSRNEGTLRLGLSEEDAVPASSALAIQLEGGIPGELGDILDRVLRAVERAAIPLLVHLCVDNPICHETIEILEGTILLGDPSIDDALLLVLSQRGGTESCTPGTSTSGSSFSGSSLSGRCLSGSSWSGSSSSGSSSAGSSSSGNSSSGSSSSGSSSSGSSSSGSSSSGSSSSGSSSSGSSSSGSSSSGSSSSGGSSLGSSSSGSSSSGSSSSGSSSSGSSSSGNSSSGSSSSGSSSSGSSTSRSSTSTVGEGVGALVDAVITILRGLRSGQSQVLRKAITPYLKDCASECLGRMQTVLSTCLTCRIPWSGIAVKLTNFGNAIRETHWLHGALDPDVQKTLQWLPKPSVMETLTVIHKFAEDEGMTYLLTKLDTHCGDCLVHHRDTGADLHCLVDALVPFWHRANDYKRRFTGLMLLENCPDSGNTIHSDCLAQLPTLKNDFVESLQQLYRACHALESPQVAKQEELSDADRKHVMACVTFTCLLAAEPYLETITCWRLPLCYTIDRRKATIVEHSLKCLSAEAWIHWISCLGKVYGDFLDNPISSPAISLPPLQSWIQRLCWEFLPTIKLLEPALGSGPALHCILTCGTQETLESNSDGSADGGEKSLASELMNILNAFKRTKRGGIPPVMQAALSLLARDGGNAAKVSDVICFLAQATPDGSLACSVIMELHKRKSKRIASVIFAAWFHAGNLTTLDKKALEAIALLLNLGVDKNSLLPSTEDIEAAALYFDEQVAEMLEEARRLDCLRVALRTTDPDGTQELLRSLDIDTPSLLEDALSILPIALLNVVEKVSDMEVEMQFPLTHLSALQKSAMGVVGAQSLLVRLLLGDSILPLGFCMHLDSDHDDVSGETLHYPWIMLRDSKPPDLPFCTGRASRATYQLSRILFRHLQREFKSLNAVYTLLADALKDLGGSCIVCGVPHYIQRSESSQKNRLHSGVLRATFCEQSICTKAFNRASRDLRLSDIGRDPDVVELLLTAVYATAESGDLSLLPGCPIQGTSTIRQLVDGMPPMALIQARTPQTLATSIGNLLSWACCHYRGFLVSATGQLRVPNLPTGTRQFVLANAAPELENAFRAHRDAQAASRILFHGTTIERLFAILCQGLRVCSGTMLQRYGACHGSGIYMAEEPATTWPYSMPSGLWGWDASAFQNMRVLLACEYLDKSAAKSVNAQGIHVITDATRLMVRYVFLLPTTATAPFARHVVPAVVSGIASIK